jgi:aminoglycoside phosphotransferase (APT) family kinase protein
VRPGPRLLRRVRRRVTASGWEAEHEVSLDEARALVATQFPDLAGAPIALLAAGWDNTVYVVDAQWAFRFPRRAVALPGIAREAAVLPALAPLLPLPVPVPERLGRPSPSFPWRFTGARLLPGAELALSGLPDETRVAAAVGLGGFLRALHAPQVVDAVDAGRLPVDPMRRADPADRLRRSRPWLEQLASAGLWQPDAAAERLLARASALAPSRADLALAHGDLHARHLLVDATGAPTGVIDWGDVCRADPVVDLSLAYGGFVGRARSAFFEAYGQDVDAASELRARVLAVSLCAALAVNAAATGPVELLTEALAGLRRALS